MTVLRQSRIEDKQSLIDNVNSKRLKNNLSVIKMAQLGDLKDLEIKPLKYPGDPDPAQNITKCPYCNSAISEKTGVPFCPNCNKIVDPVKGGPYQRKVPEKGERYKDFGPKDTYINPSVPFNRSAQSKDHLKRNKKNNDIAKYSPDTVKDVFISDPFDACEDPRKKNGKFDDVNKEDIMRSCEDLAIDG